jgi:hypothetical protein
VYSKKFAVPPEFIVSATMLKLPPIVNDPPAVTPVVALLSNDLTVIFWLIVTVKVFEYTSSADVGNDPVFQIAVFDQLPVATA